jgi:hypothetical protein
MADEQLAITPSEPAAPAIEQEVVQDNDTIDLDQSQDVAEVEESEDDYEDFENDDGKVYRVHKALKPNLLKNRDYTQKTQETAAIKRELEAQRAQQTQVAEEDLDDRASVRSIKAQLEKYKDVDWISAHRQDPMGTREHEIYVNQLREALGEAEHRIAERQTTRTQEAERTFATRFEETRQFAQEKIPGWSPELSSKVLQYADSEGITEDFFRANLSPTLIKILHRAYIGEQALKKQTTARPAPAPITQPLATVGTKANPTTRTNLRDLAKSDVVSDAYVAARKRGVGGKASY